MEAMQTMTLDTAVTISFEMQPVKIFFVQTLEKTDLVLLANVPL